MKIHPNEQINDMLKDGTAKIVDRKYVRYRLYSPNGSYYNSVRYEPADRMRPDVSAPPAPIPVIPEILPAFAPVPVISEAPPVLAPVPVISEAPPVPAPIPVIPEILPALAPVPVISEAPPVPAPVPVIPETPPALAPVPVIPEAPPALAPAPVTPGVRAKVLQPESAPGGLIAEIYAEGATSDQILGTLPGFASVIPGMAGTAYAAAQGPEEEDFSYPPYLSFITFNRLGLTVKNLGNLLDSGENFELNIIDCNSKDNSWDYIQSLNDPRIKSRIRFEKNFGPIFATNFALSRRKPGQFFIVMDSDTFIKTKDWIARFMEVFRIFPQVGLLGLMRDNPYPRFLPPVIPRVSGNVAYLELKNADIETPMDFIPGQLQCLRPRLIREIGYWSEENGFGDAEMSPRIVHYTDFKVGFVTTIEIDMTQRISCNECLGKNYCTLSRSINDCFALSRQYNKNESFVAKNTWKFKQTFQELKAGERTAFCASIHDQASMMNHKYNRDWALDNFNHYILNGN